MGFSDNSGTKYSVTVAFVFVFNLIVGAGALALPLAFQSAGLILGSIFLSLLCFLSYVTITFMIETQAIANALINRDGDEVSKILVSAPEPIESSREMLANSGGLNCDNSSSLFYIKERLEVSQMAEIFLGPWGQRFFFIVMIIYLYGDLAIYAVAVPSSILQVSGTWLSLNENQVYYVYLASFAVIFVPLTFFDFQKTRYLQILTLAIRNVSLFGMIIIATIYDGEGKGSVPESWLNWTGFPDIFGTAIYAFMCHHSLPSIITPIKNQKRVKLIMLFDNIFVLITYTLLCWTALWAFGNVTNPTCSTNPGKPCTIQKLYTLNFASYDIKPIAIFLVLYPVFTLSTNFPLIAITLRNNLMELITYRRDMMNPTLRRSIFALLASIPPLVIACITRNVETLVGITGSYAGLGIMFFFPAILVYFARKQAHASLGLYVSKRNFLASPFGHVGWVYMIFVWCILALAGTIFRQIWISIGNS